MLHYIILFTRHNFSYTRSVIYYITWHNFSPTYQECNMLFPYVVLGCVSPPAQPCPRCLSHPFVPWDTTGCPSCPFVSLVSWWDQGDSLDKAMLGDAIGGVEGTWCSQTSCRYRTGRVPSLSKLCRDCTIHMPFKFVVGPLHFRVLLVSCVDFFFFLLFSFFRNIFPRWAGLAGSTKGLF